VTRSSASIDRIQSCVASPAAFLRNYILRRGILDGVPGLIISSMNAYYVFLKFAKLRALTSLTSGGNDLRPR